MAGKQSDYESMRKRAEARVKRRQEFMQHLGVYVIVNLFLWVVWYTIKQMFFGVGFFEFPWPVLVTFGWGVGLALHALDTYFKSGMADVRREMAVEREIEREMAMRGMRSNGIEGKPKRDRIVRLSDDGELIPADQDDSADWADEMNGNRR